MADTSVRSSNRLPTDPTISAPDRYVPNQDYFKQLDPGSVLQARSFDGIVRPTYIAQPVTAADAYQSQYNSDVALRRQADFVSALQRTNGIQNQQNVYNALSGVANGVGPNPALAQLNQATGQNVANQAALMASQRGGSANAGLLARQIAQQQASTQQQAVGQAATMQSQNQLAALGQLNGLTQNQVSNQGQAEQYFNQAAQAQQAMQLNALSNQNNANVAMQSNINNGRVGLEGGQVSANAAVTGGIISGVGAGLGALAKIGAAAYQGGIVEKYADGGQVMASPQPIMSYGSYLSGGQMMNRGGMMAAGGGPVRGGQAQVKGDSPKNDTVPALLSPKEIVIPRSITMGKNAPEKAAEFVRQVLARQGKKK